MIMLNYLYLLQVTGGLNFSETEYSSYLRTEEKEDFFYNGEELFDNKLEIML